MRVVKALGMTMQPRAECLDCDWEHPGHRTARDEAKWHVRSTGHEVMVVIETRDTYRRVGT